MTRLAYSEQEILRLLRSHPTRQISYDNLAAATHGGLDRRTMITAMRRLEYRHLVVTIRGQGRTPNQYLLTDENREGQ